MNKLEVYVRFPNEGTYYNKIKLDPDKISNPQEFLDEVFCTIDNLRIAIPKTEWDRLKKNKL